MPIRFRCGYCNKLLGIARRKAGTQTTCPHCGAAITVPVPDDDMEDELDEIDALLKGGTPAGEPASSPQRSPPATGGERPLFERDIDSVLGPTKKAAAAPPAPQPQTAHAPGMDATSLGAPGVPYTTGAQRTTAIIVCVLVLLMMAFAAGFLIASR